MDHPELKLSVASKPILPPKQPVPSPVPVLEVTPPVTDPETESLTSFLSDRLDPVLITELTDCLRSDKTLVKSLLANTRFFSLRDLRKHSERLGFSTPKPTGVSLPSPEFTESFEKILDKTIPKSTRRRRFKPSQAEPVLTPEEADAEMQREEETP